MYPSVSSSVLSFYQCRDINGVNYLVTDFHLRCGDEEWMKWLPLASVALVVYPIGVPAILFVALYQRRKRLKEPEVMASLGIIYEVYPSLSSLLSVKD